MNIQAVMYQLSLLAESPCMNKQTIEAINNAMYMIERTCKRFDISTSDSVTKADIQLEEVEQLWRNEPFR
jgi:hypothetical protein